MTRSIRRVDNSLTACTCLNVTYWCRQTLHLSYISSHTSELKRIWHTLQEMIGRFVFTMGGPKVCVITAFWTGSIWGETTQRSHQRFSNTGGNSEASVFPNCNAPKGSTEWMEMREKGAEKKKAQVNDWVIRWRGCKQWGGKKKKRRRVNWKGSSDWCGQEGVCFLNSSWCCCLCLSSWVTFKRFNSCYS